MAGTNPGGGGRRGMIAGINITPMVDVMLVLLVIMMVSSTYIVSQSLRVNLPSSASSDGAPPATAIVTIEADGSWRFNTVSVTEDELIVHFRDAVAAAPDVTVVISADRTTGHGDVVRTMDLARQQRITSFAVQVERAAGAGADP